ncbi:hypothetical protein BgiMline_002569, partial [Biomphalaria glabrata]
MFNDVITRHHRQVLILSVNIKRLLPVPSRRRSKISSQLKLVMATDVKLRHTTRCHSTGLLIEFPPFLMEGNRKKLAWDFKCIISVSKIKSTSAVNLKLTQFSNSR